MKKGQASLELLTTYGWIIVSTIIVISAITYFAFSDTTKYIEDRCWFGAQLPCTDYSIQKLSDTETRVFAMLRNNYLTPIAISQVESIDFRYSLIGCTLPLNFSVKESMALDCMIGSDVDIGKKVEIPLKLTIISSLTNTSTNVTGQVSSAVPKIQALGTVQCNDGIDNDGNGCTDFSGDDSGCLSPSDFIEIGGSCEQAWSGGANLSCSVRDVGDCSDTVLFRISARHDAHAELETESNYDYEICCKTAVGVLDTTCVGSDFTLFRISDVTDGHGELANMSTFTNDICLSLTPNDVGCRFTTTTCIGEETCVATLSNTSGGHFGDCTTSSFRHRVCCEEI